MLLTQQQARGEYTVMPLEFARREQEVEEPLLQILFAENQNPPHQQRREEPLVECLEHAPEE